MDSSQSAVCAGLGAAAWNLCCVQLLRNVSDAVRCTAPTYVFTLLFATSCFVHVQAGARLAVSEMVIAATLQSGSKASRHLMRFHPSEELRSVQLYGVRPEPLDWACRWDPATHSACLLLQGFYSTLREEVHAMLHAEQRCWAWQGS